MRATITFRGRGLAVLGGLLLLLAAAQADMNRRLVARGQVSMATVDYPLRGSVLVRIDEAGASTLMTKTWWSWPWRYRRGQRIRVVYDPVQVARGFTVFFRPRQDSWPDLWLTPTLFGGTGGLLLLLGLTSAGPAVAGGVLIRRS